MRRIPVKNLLFGKDMDESAKNQAGNYKIDFAILDFEQANLLFGDILGSKAPSGVNDRFQCYAVIRVYLDRKKGSNYAPHSSEIRFLNSELQGTGLNSIKIGFFGTEEVIFEIVSLQDEYGYYKNMSEIEVRIEDLRFL